MNFVFVVFVFFILSVCIDGGGYFVEVKVFFVVVMVVELFDG